tara:strand:+ start:14031 stop:14309 length:279 start_codon:yes stop_codon:yes gene_type:complete
MAIEMENEITVAWDSNGFIHPNFVATQMESRASDWNKEFKNKAVRVKILASCFPHFTGRQLLDISEGHYEFSWEEVDGQYNMAFTLKDGEEE